MSVTSNNKPVFDRGEQVPAVDVRRVARAQLRLISLHRRLGSWRAVGVYCGVNHRYPYQLASFGMIPANPEIRVKLYLPRVLPSERKTKAARSPMPKVWENPFVYFKKVKK